MNEQRRRKPWSYLVLLMAVMLAACSDEYKLDPARKAYICKTDNFTGYVISDAFIKEEACNTGKLYIDNGEATVRAKSVHFTQEGRTIYVEGPEVKKQACLLTPYRNLSYKVVPEGVDYCTSAFAIKTQRNVEYARAEGYWTSYPEDFRDFSDIYKDKAELVLQGKTEQALTMDIYEPKDEGTRRRPLLVMIHGGGFYNGDKADEEYRFWCERFAACGYTAISVNYRLGWAPYQTSIIRSAYRGVQDVNAAIRFMLANQEEYKVDPNRIYLAGCSAGAITALNVAFMTDETRPTETREIAFPSDIDMGPINAVPVAKPYAGPISIRAVANMWGAMFDLDMLSNSNTKIISIHSSNDPIVPYDHNVPFKEMLSKVPNTSSGLLNGILGGLIRVGVDLTVPETYGSGLIDQRCKEIGRESQLETFDEVRHTLIRNDDTNLNNRHGKFFEIITRFFQKDMLEHSAHLVNSTKNCQEYILEEDEDVETCSWAACGGVITACNGRNKVTALFFDDAPGKAINVNGIYKSGIPFSQRIEIR